MHALAQSVAPINDAMEREWPECVRMNLLDDSLSADLAAAGGVADEAMHERFAQLGDYAASTGIDGILFTCSAFGSCIDGVIARLAPMPVLKPNESMIQEAVGGRYPIGLLATFRPTIASMLLEFPPGIEVHPRFVEGAMDALSAGEVESHDALIAEAAKGLRSQGCGTIALAQFSMARAASRVRRTVDVPILTTVDSAVRELRKRITAATT